MEISKKELKEDFTLVKKFYDKFVFRKGINYEKIRERAGIGGNTFRSLRINKEKHPSEVFRQWAFEQYDIIKEKILKNSNIEYFKIHNEMVKSLENKFNENRIKYTKNKITVPFSICAKFIDLFIEFSIQPNIDLPLTEQMKVTNYLKKNAFVPLDSYTLKAIACLIKNENNIPTKIITSGDINLKNKLLENYQTLSMGFIFKLSKGKMKVESEIYYKLQALIDEIMRINNLKYERIYFDKWAWNNPEFK